MNKLRNKKVFYNGNVSLIAEEMDAYGISEITPPLDVANRRVFRIIE